jgi:hypothetical protein
MINYGLKGGYLLQDRFQPWEIRKGLFAKVINCAADPYTLGEKEQQSFWKFSRIAEGKLVCL